MDQSGSQQVIESCCQEACRIPPGDENLNSLAGFLTHLTDTSSYPARWNCGQWTALEGWLHIYSDIGIFLAYFAIPVSLVYFVSRRKDVPFYGIFFLFAAFIMACGTGHLLEAVIFYYPIYRIAGLLKLFTAVISLITVVALLRLLPKLLELPGIVSNNEILRKADQAKSEFLANMSHEIRTPMTAILGYTEILQDESSEELTVEKRKELLRIIEQNGQHLLYIINDVLDLSKIEAGKLSVEHTEFNIQYLLHDVKRLMKIKADAKNLPLQMNIKTPVPETINSDASRITQILVNLLGNAIKFTHQGEIKMDVQFHKDEENSKSMLCIDIIDSGIGLSLEEQSQLFKPFSQADTSVCRKYGGTGLGLTISKKLAKLLNGDVFILKSRPGFGTTFRFILDLTQAHSPLMINPEHIKFDTVPIVMSVREPQKKYDFSGKKILLAEDGVDNQRLISYFLKKTKASLMITDNGKEAVEIIQDSEVRSEPFDLILMDMQMPVMDGYQAVTELRNLGNDLPIIALTAHAMQGDRERCLEAGCNEYMTKPLNRHKFLELVENYLFSPQQNSRSKNIEAVDTMM